MGNIAEFGATSYNMGNYKRETAAMLDTSGGLRHSEVNAMPRKNCTTDKPFRRCNRGEKCIAPGGPLLPATEEFFRGRNRYGHIALESVCRHCERAYIKEHQKTHPSKKSGIKYADLSPMAKSRNLESAKRYANSPKGKARITELNQSDKRKAERKEYWRSPRGRAVEKAKKMRREARKLSLPDQFSAQDWLDCLNYWHGCCAYCGSQQGLWNPMTADHFIPLASSDCPGTIVTNMLPACRSCNSSKHDNEPSVWLIKRFGSRKAARISRTIVQYFNKVNTDA